MNWKDFIPPILIKKTNKLNRLITAYLLGQPVWTEANFENLAKEGFNKNVWVYRCVMEIAKAGSNIPFILYRRDSKGDLQEVKQHQLLDLLWRPNPFMSKQEFMENIIAFTQLAGNSYFYHNGPKNQPPRELWVMRSDRVKIIPDKDNFIKGYQYEVNGNKAIFDSHEVSHIRLFNALDDFYGLSPIQVGARAIDADNFANSWNASLLQNNARPSGAMVTEGTLGDAEYKRLKKAIEEKYSGHKNAGKPMLLEGGLDWKEMSLSPQEMDFVNSKSMTRLEICSAFGVPPEIVGDHEHATYSNYQEARKGFYQDTVIPVMTKIIDVLNNDLVPKFGENLFLDIDKDKIDALQEDRDKVFNRTINAVRAGILEVNEAREAMGYEAKEGGNVRYVPVGVIPEGEDAPDLTELLGINSNINNDDDNDNNNNDDEDGVKKLEFKALNPRTKIEKKQYWRSFDRMRYGYFGSAGKVIAKRFNDEREKVLKAFEEGGEEGVTEYLDSEENIREWNKTLASVYLAVMDVFGNRVYDSLMEGQKNRQTVKTKAEEEEDEESLFGTEPPPKFNVYDSAVQNFISTTVAEKVVNINDTTKTKLKAIIRRGFDERLTIWEIRDQIDTLYLEQIIPNRSRVIARTEVISSSNAGSRYAAKQTGLKLKKEWVATADKRTRDTHEKADGQIKDIDEPYEVGNSSLMFPGDPSGKAEEVIQCRCTEVYHTID